MKHRATGTAAYQGMFTLRGGPAYLHTALLLSGYEAKGSRSSSFSKEVENSEGLGDMCVYLYV